MARPGVQDAGGWLWRPLVGASLSQVALGIVRPTASYAGLANGADATLIGVIAASFAVLPMLVALPIGALAGRARLIGAVPAASAALAVLACALAAVSPGLPSLLIACGLFGVANLGILVGAQAWISRSAPADRYNGGFGWMTAGMALGQAIGPLAAGVVLGAGSVVSTQAISTAFWLAGAVAVPIAVVFSTRAVRRYEDTEPGERMEAVQILRRPGVARAIVVGAAVLTSVDILIAYLPVIGAEASIAPVVVGAMLAVRGLSSMLSRLMLGPLGRRWDAAVLIVASAAGSAACLLVIVLFPAPWVIFMALTIGGFLLGMGQPLSMTAVAVALPAPARSSGLALRLLGNRIAQTAVPLAAGAISAAFGTASVLVIQVIALSLSAIWEAGSRRPR